MSLERFGSDGYSADDLDAADRAAPHGEAEKGLPRPQWGRGFQTAGPGRPIRLRAANAGAPGLPGAGSRGTTVAYQFELSARFG